MIGLLIAFIALVYVACGFAGAVIITYHHGSFDKSDIFPAVFCSILFGIFLLAGALIWVAAGKIPQDEYGNIWTRRTWPKEIGRKP